MMRPHFGRAKTALLFTLALGAAGAAMCSASGVTNLLSNGGFEELDGGMPRGWSVPPHLADRGTASVDTANVHSGQRSLLLAPNKRNTAEGFAVYTPLDYRQLQGREITLAGYVAVASPGGNTVAALLKAGGDNWLLLPKETAGKFVPFSKTCQVPTTATEAALLLFVGGTQGRVWFDDLSVTIGTDTRLKTGLEPSNPSGTTVVGDTTLQSRINTDGWQDSAFVSPDGRELYFAYMPFAQTDFMNIYLGKIKPQEVKLRGPDRPGNHGGMNFETYVSLRRTDGTWTTPRNLNINSNYNLYSAKLSPDGKQLFYAIRDYSQNIGGDDIYVSRRQNDGLWTPPQNLGTNINTQYREDTPCLSPDGTQLYFARNQAETLGWQIYVSTRVNDTWGKAVKVPQPINQSSPETTANYQPFITADGKEFYFTRIQKLYVSKRKSNGTWDTPQPVFPRLDVSGHASVTADGKHLYFLTAADKASLERHCWTVWVAERMSDGTWGNARRVD